MKKIILFVLAIMFGSYTFAAGTGDDTQIIDAIDQQNTQDILKDAKELKENIKFQRFSTCQEMDKVLTDFASRYIKARSQYAVNGVGMALDDKALSSVSPMAEGMGGGAAVDYSQTNVQVEGVDEPEILKTDGRYFYYYNEQQKRIYIISSPLDMNTSNVDISRVNIVKTIKIPQTFYNTKIFLSDGKLVIISTRYINTVISSIVDNTNRTNVIIYNVSDIQNIKLQKMYDVNGNFQDARLINNRLYLISNIYINLYNPMPLYKSSMPMAASTSSEGIQITSSQVLPKEIELNYNPDTKNGLKSGGKTLPYDLSISNILCNDVLYLLPSDESIQKYGLSPSLALISEIDISDTSKSAKTTMVFGDVSQIHMSDDSLYLANNFYVGYNFSCPIGAMCLMPYYRSGENTLIHKFSLDPDKAIKYQNTNIIPGSPLNQYSMSEDDKGNFRILTNTWWPNLDTHLFVLDKTLNLVGSLMNIQPQEQFKSSRFIGDKLYLVTFQQVDPLFVIDIANPVQPKKIGELEIPGFSTYLHPYASEQNGVQYLIGLGYGTAQAQWGVVTSGIKIDLYKVDYTKFSGDSISVEQLYTKSMGGKGSWSEALDNPRMFVWDANKKQLVLPMLLEDEKKLTRCPKDSSGTEYCYDQYINTPTFAGIKVFSVDAASGISEVASKDYLSMFKNPTPSGPYDIYNEWQFRGSQMRVGYIGDVIYGINNLFADFMNKSDVNNSNKIDFSQDSK